MRTVVWMFGPHKRWAGHNPAWDEVADVLSTPVTAWSQYRPPGGVMYNIAVATSEPVPSGVLRYARIVY